MQGKGLAPNNIDLYPSANWNDYVEALNSSGITMAAMDQDLIDNIWTDERPAQPNTHLYSLPHEFSGTKKLF